MEWRISRSWWGDERGGGTQKLEYHIQVRYHIYPVAQFHSKLMVRDGHTVSKGMGENPKMSYRRVQPNICNAAGALERTLLSVLCVLVYPLCQEGHPWFLDTHAQTQFLCKIKTNNFWVNLKSKCIINPLKNNRHYLFFGS